MNKENIVKLSDGNYIDINEVLAFETIMDDIPAPVNPKNGDIWIKDKYGLVTLYNGKHFKLFNKDYCVFKDALDKLLKR